MEQFKGKPPADFAAAEPVEKDIHKVVVRVLPRDLSIEDGELTATMKVRRQRVMENFNLKFKDSIDDLYAGKEV